MFAAIAKAAAAAPQFDGLATVPGRVLLVDGDALCYTCAGRDDTDPAQARTNVRDRIERALRASGSERAIVLVTARGSHKGHRYAVARVKPYQGQRSSGRRPKNWEYLRGLVESGVPGHDTDVTHIAEADDLFRKYGHQLGWANVVHHTQDKDMRQIPGWHLTWDDFYMVHAPLGTWALTAHDKVYGRKWFWLQMLHGDTADNIPGLPKMTKPDGRQALCGPATAEKLLEGCDDEAAAKAVVVNQYREYYGERWPENLLEQGILLWLRQNPGQLFDVMAEGHPLYSGPVVRGGIEFGMGMIMQRVAEAQACLS